MFLKASKKIADVFVNNKIISNEDKEIYRYGVQQGFILLLNFFTIVTLGLIYGMLKEAFVFTLTYVPLRSYAGGFHAKTHMKCYACSILIINIVLLIIKFSMFSEIICYSIVFFSSMVIFFLSPVEDENKPLDEKEKKVYHIRTGRILFLEVICFCIVIVNDFFEIAYAILLALFFLSVLLILGKIKNLVIKR